MAGPSSSPSLRRARIPVGLAVALGVALMMACTDDSNDDGVDDNQFRSDVLDCESAVAHLKTCCGAAFNPAQLACHHLYAEDQGCGDGRVERDDPDLGEDESDCIRGEDCATIAKNDVCARAMQRGIVGARSAAVDGGPGALSPGVCP